MNYASFSFLHFYIFFIHIRNCLVGSGYHIKIGDIGSDNPLYERDYHEMDKHLVPIRWMAWESTLLVSLAKEKRINKETDNDDDKKKKIP